MNLTLFAIKHIPTGHYLPTPSGWGGRGGSHVEPAPVTTACLPRLFHTEVAAKIALTYWLKGKTTVSHSYPDEGEDWHIEPQNHRKADEMEVVPVNLEFPHE